ncbi:MAG: VOC family protein [Chloroflexota bacterium]|nr:VOC family protein [Chloroflexota bacterium]
MIRHVAGIAEIVDDLKAAVSFYRHDLGLEVDDSASADYASVKIPGVVHFGLWSREAAAEATFGDRSAVDRVAPGLTIEFEVDEVPAATQALEGRGIELLHGPKTEPWGQTTARFALPSGVLCGIAETPWARQIDD